MAASIAVDGVEKLVGMILQQLANEASLVVNFRKDFEWVNRKLTFTKAYLKDAHQKSSHNDAVKQWLGELRDVAFDLEDIVDECVAVSLYHTCAGSCSLLIFKWKIGRRIRDLKARMNSIVADAAPLNLFSDLVSSEQASTSSSKAEQWKRSSLLESNARPVAIEAKVDEILRLLDDAAHRVIGVVGMGGVGKTFLLQNVYKDTRTQGMFEKCIWLSVSQTYSLRKLQADLASSLDLTDVVHGQISEERSAELIHSSLQEQKFLIMLDDVWRVTSQENLIQKLGVPLENTQGKIVVTTRNMEVCKVMNASFIFRMEVLEKEDSWNLFCAYAFAEQRPPQYLSELSHQVETKCGRLPLALKIVGASMADQTLVEQWKSKLQKLNEVKDLKDPVQEILMLSYDSLPADVKPCFLYLAFFGEDETIEVEYLIELWKAEGLISEGDDWREMGLNYFYKLSNMCLVEAWENSSLDIYCRIHDLVRDLAIYICKENKCAFIMEEGCIKASCSCSQYLSQPDKTSGCRRIFLAKQGIADDDISHTMLLFPTCLRTLSLSRNEKVFDIPARLFSKVRALRVLDLSVTSISRLPSSIGCLKLLRVLNLNGTQIKEVPYCIRTLKNLRMLHLFGESTLRKVPEWVSELKCLENLEIWAESMPRKTSKLISLRVLRLIDVKLSVEKNGLLRLKDVGNLIHLQQLRIQIKCEAELQRMEEGVLERLMDMRRLTLHNYINSDAVPLLAEKFRSMTYLEYLRLQKFNLPRSLIRDLVNLRFLSLDGCDCIDYSAVESLPNLISLQLLRNERCRGVRELFGKWGAFPKLRFLQIKYFRMLEELIVLEGGSMPCLEKFELTDCMIVGRVGGLEKLKSLKEFNFNGSGTDECRERLKEDWKKIEVNNPRVVQIIIN